VRLFIAEAKVFSNFVLIKQAKIDQNINLYFYMMTKYNNLFIFVILFFLNETHTTTQIHHHTYFLFASIVLCSILILAFRVTQIKTYSWDNAQVVLVGNKSDMQNERVVTYDRGKQFADHLGA
jgi:hypothetical protein